MKQALRFYGLLLAALLMASACGASAPAEEEGIDAGTSVNIDADMGCQGCVDVFGNCEPGDQDRDCGGGGATCETCLNGAVCAENECLTPPTCTPENCTGCCDGDTCIEGGDQGAAQCGVDGLACTACDSGICTAGACIEACTPGTCTGCCAGPTIDDCVEVGDDQSAAACGVEGMACAACANGATCTQGVCVDTQCNLDCPNGCCEGSTCRDGDADNQCGTGGEACFSCGADQTCDAGICLVDPDSLWNFLIVSVDVPSKDSNGDAWDAFGGAPDPFVEVTLGVDTATPVVGETTQNDNSENTDSIEFDPAEVVITNVAASKILDSIRLRVYDADVAVHDLIVSIIDNMPPEAVFGGGLFQLSTGTGINKSTIRFRVVKP